MIEDLTLNGYLYISQGATVSVIKVLSILPFDG
jgi:hypothetical protein